MTPSLYDQCAAHCYLYYVLSDPVIPDWQYDQLERECVAAGFEPPVHSDLRESYSPDIIALAEEYRQ